MRIVVADPDVRLQELLHTVLVPQGHEVLPVGDAHGAQSLLRTARPDVVLVDPDLPGGGGIEALAGWRSTPPGRAAHVVVISARSAGDPAVRVALARLSTRRALRKPFSMFDLGDMLDAIRPTPRPPTPTPAPTAPKSSGASGVDHLTRLLGRAPSPRQPVQQRPTVPPVDASPGNGYSSSVASASNLGASRPVVAPRPAPGSARSSSLPAAIHRAHQPMRANRSLVPRSGGAVSRDNAARLGALWANKDTGRLYITGASAAVSRPIRFESGGLVDSRELELVDMALREGRLRFESGAVEGSGDHRALGSYLVESLRPDSLEGFAAEHTFNAPSLRRLARPLTELPVGRDTRAVLSMADGRQTLGRILAMLSVPGETVETELFILHRMGILSLNAPRSERRPRTAARAAAPLSPSSGPEPLSEPTAPATDPGPSRTTSVSEPPTTTTPSRRSTGSTRHRRSTTRTQASSRRRMPPVQPAILAKQLRRELSRLEGASAANVLGVPSDSPTELVQGVASRQIERYGKIADGVTNSAEIRALAAQLKALVEAALSGWGHSVRTRSGAADSERELMWLEQGRILVESGDFARADRLLSKARDLTIANPDILAWLGLARLRNPERSSEEQLDEGIDLLLLAEQFNPGHQFAVMWLARVLSAEGDTRRALPRAKKWAQLCPDDKEAAALVTKLEAAASPKAR